jgi:hypothetical protein
MELQAELSYGQREKALVAVVFRRMWPVAVVFKRLWLVDVVFRRRSILSSAVAGGT